MVAAGLISKATVQVNYFAAAETACDYL